MSRRIAEVFPPVRILTCTALLLATACSKAGDAEAKPATGAGSSSSTGNGILDLYNKFDYGYGGGVEIHPVSNLLIGARVNISLGDLYQTPTSTTTQPSFIPKVDVKNNLFQIYAGWKFGKSEKKKKKETK